MSTMDSHDWDLRYSGTDLVWTAEPNRFVVAETEALEPGSALDLAAGEGRNAVWLAERGWRVTAVDFSQVAIEKGERLAERRGVRVEWVVADLVEYGPEPQAYDLVLIAYLHLPQPQMTAVLARAAQALAPGGMLVFVGHDVTNLTEGTGGPQDASILHTPADVATALTSVSGVMVEGAERVQRAVGERVAVDTLVRAVRL